MKSFLRQTLNVGINHATTTTTNSTTNTYTHTHVYTIKRAYINEFLTCNVCIHVSKQCMRHINMRSIIISYGYAMYVWMYACMHVIICLCVCVFKCSINVRKSRRRRRSNLSFTWGKLFSAIFCCRFFFLLSAFSS